MDNQILKVKQMKLDTLKSRGEQILTEIYNMTLLDTSIATFDKKIDDSRHILNNLEQKNQSLAAELMKKEIFQQEQIDKFDQFGTDSITIKAKLEELESQSALQRLKNLSCEENIHKEQAKLDKANEELTQLDEQRKIYNSMWNNLSETISGFITKFNGYGEIKKM